MKEIVSNLGCAPHPAQQPLFPQILLDNSRAVNVGAALYGAWTGAPHICCQLASRQKLGSIGCHLSPLWFMLSGGSDLQSSDGAQLRTEICRFRRAGRPARIPARSLRRRAGSLNAARCGGSLNGTAGRNTEGMIWIGEAIRKFAGEGSGITVDLKLTDRVERRRGPGLDAPFSWLKLIYDGRNPLNRHTSIVFKGAENDQLHFPPRFYD